MDQDNGKMLALIDGYKDEMVGTMSKMVAIPSISPLSDGKGEGARADFLEGLLKSWGFEVKVEVVPAVRFWIFIIVEFPGQIHDPDRLLYVFR